MCRSLITALILLCAFDALAQEYSDHILTTDSVYSQGSVRMIGPKKLEFRISKISEPAIYALDDIVEYTSGNNTYEALVINSEREFYRKYIEGNVNLYFKRGTYILKSGNNLTSFNRKNFRSAIGSIIKKCEGDPSLSKLTYTKPAIKAVVKSSNDGQCNADMITYRKIGVIAGYNLVTTTTSPNSTTTFKESSPAPFAGLFVELPIARKKGIYLSADATGTGFQPSYYNQSPSGTAFMVLRIKGVNANASIKFLMSTPNIKPYLKLGVFSSYLKVDCPTGLITTETDGQTINITNTKQYKVSSTQQTGINVASGVEIPVSKRKNVHLEVRYNRSVANDVTDFDLALSSMGIVAGFNL